MDEEIKLEENPTVGEDKIEKTKTVIVKINPSKVKKSLEPKINKVYVVPNKSVKKSILKRLNDPTAEIIDASTIYNSRNGQSICNSTIHKVCEENKKQSVYKLEYADDINDEVSCQDSYFEKTISVSPDQKDDFDSEISKHEVSNVNLQMFNEGKENIKYCHEYNDGDLDTHSNVLIDDAQSKKCNLSWINSRRNKDQEERMQLAIEAVLKSNMSVKRAAHVFGIRYGVLVSKINKAGTSCKSVLGADPALTEKEELALVEWIRSRYKNGCPVKKIDLVNRVADIVSDGRSTRFKDGRPGEKWFNNFLSRNPSVALLGPATRCDSREVPSKPSLTAWFGRCEDHLKAFGQSHLLTVPKRIGCVEELTLCLLSSKTKVSKGNGSSNGVMYLPEEKSGNIIVLLGACADGTLTPPMPVFSCRKPPPALINSIPSGWGIGLSKDGNINKEVLHSYFKNILIPWLSEQNRLPFILFIDKLKSFLSVDTADFCAQKGLLIYNFYPNSSRVLQPLFKSVLEPIRKSWGSLSTHKNDKEALLQFSPTLNQVLFDLAPPYAIIDSFKYCGIYPFDPKAPDYSKCVLCKEGKESKIFSSNEFAVALEVFEDLIGSVKTEIFQETLKGFKLLKSEDSSLFKIWRNLISKVDITRISSDTEEYKHEKIIRGADRKLPRPEMYLMVVEEEEGYMQSVSKFNNDKIRDQNIEAYIDEPASETELEIDYIKDDGTVSEMEDARIKDTNKPSAIWKDKYQSHRVVQGKDDKKLKKERRLDRIEKKLKREQKIEILDQDEVATKRLKKAIGPRYCIQCMEEKGKLIMCMVCRSHIHFECMMEDEQQILSDLYEDQVAFDYICPGCCKN
ncbi:UNVERIFIED_CONTAM: hypothetical protein RMT77_010827 [Armadillidium vulgare]